MAVILIYIVIIVVYICLPLPLQIVGFLLNTYIPDPIPVLDEVIMFIAMIKKLNNLIEAIDFWTSLETWQKVLLVLTVIGAIVGIVFLIKHFFF